MLSQWLDQIITYTDQYIRLGNTLTTYILAVLLAIGAYLVLYLFKLILVNKIEDRTTRTNNTIDDAVVKSLERIPSFTYLMVSVYVGSLYLEVVPWLDKAISALFVVLVIAQVGLMLKNVILHAIEERYSTQAGSQNTVSIVRIWLNILIWVTVFLLVLTNLWFAITPLLTSLGIMWVAVAFALQNVLEDLFSSVSIYLDQPFAIGDFVEVDDVTGVVTEIGIKSTRIKTIRGEEVVIANRHIIDKVLRNYGKIQHRTVRHTIWVVYGTDQKLLQKIPGLLQEAIEKAEHAAFERAHFTTFGDYALQFEYMYTIDDKEYMVYLNVQQEVNFEIRRLFAKHKISIAFPTQRVLMEKEQE